MTHDPIVVPAQEGLECPVCLKPHLRISEAAVEVIPDTLSVRVSYDAECEECGFRLQRKARDDIPVARIIEDAVGAEVRRLAYASGGH